MPLLVQQFFDLDVFQTTVPALVAILYRVCKLLQTALLSHERGNGVRFPKAYLQHRFRNEADARSGVWRGVNLHVQFDLPEVWRQGCQAVPHTTKLFFSQPLYLQSF